MVVCERLVTGIDPQGITKDVLFSVGIPERVGGDWAAVGTIGESRRRIYGFDAWQALQLCFRYINSEIQGLEDEGWSFYRNQSADKIDVANF